MIIIGGQKATLSPIALIIIPLFNNSEAILAPTFPGSLKGAGVLFGVSSRAPIKPRDLASPTISWSEKLFNFDLKIEDRFLTFCKIFLS